METQLNYNPLLALGGQSPEPMLLSITSILHTSEHGSGRGSCNGSGSAGQDLKKDQRNLPSSNIWHDFHHYKEFSSVQVAIKPNG